MKLTTRMGGLLVAILVVAAGMAGAAEKERLFSQSQFSRYTEKDDRPRLETAIATFTGKDGFTVDLVAAVHIGDPAYYQALNDRFKQYDAVLYEMVSATQDPEPPVKGERGNHPISMMQRGLKAMMGLSFQLDEVDYSPANFVHADMDIRQFLAAQEKRGESLMGLVLKAYMAQMNGGAPQPRAANAEVYKPIDWGTTPESRRRAMKLMFAQMISDLERQALQLDGPEGSAILTDRNDACLKVLRAQRKAGKKKIAVFYGAAHLPDMATKLVKTDQLKAGQTEWLTAWDIAATTPATQPVK
jgi:hypothetical protein